MSDNVDWRPTLERVGIPADVLTGKNCKCPLCGQGKRSFRFTDYRGQGMFICSKCTPEGGNGFELIKRYFGIDFDEALAKVRGNTIITHQNKGLSQERKYAQNREVMIEQYRNLVPGRGTPAETYLAKRGIPFPDPFYFSFDGSEAWRDRREAFGCFWLPNFQDGFGAMVWKAIDPTVPHLSQLHFTMLTPMGDKAPVEQVKKYSKAIGHLETDAYRVAPLTAGDPNVCIIAEGIETALAAREIYMRLAPGEQGPTTYASMDAGMMKRFRPYTGDINQQRWWICGDLDESNTGQQAAAACKMQIGNMMGGYDRVHVVLPPHMGQDWNDVLTSGVEQDMMRICQPI